MPRKRGPLSTFHRLERQISSRLGRSRTRALAWGAAALLLACFLIAVAGIPWTFLSLLAGSLAGIAWLSPKSQPGRRTLIRGGPILGGIAGAVLAAIVLVTFGSQTTGRQALATLATATLIGAFTGTVAQLWTRFTTAFRKSLTQPKPRQPRSSPVSRKAQS